MAIKHGRKNAKPQHTTSQQQSDNSPVGMPGLPWVEDPGEMLSHDQVPGAGFAPH